MRSLIIDTTRSSLLVMVDNGSQVFFEYCQDQSFKHMKILLFKIDEILKKGGLEVGDIDCFCAVIGPGSYTGIRIGACHMTAMARALDKKLVAVNALEIVKEQHLAAIGGVDEKGDKPHTKCQDTLSGDQDNAECLGLYLIDNGHDYYALQVKDKSSEYFILDKQAAEKHCKKVVRDEGQEYHRELLAIVKKKIANGDFADILKPIYMKKSQAGQAVIDSVNDVDNTDLL